MSSYSQGREPKHQELCMYWIFVHGIRLHTKKAERDLEYQLTQVSINSKEISISFS